MNIRPRYLWSFTTVFLGVVLISGCGSTQPTHFYQLSSLPYTEPEEKKLGNKKREMIGIGPVEIPSYVDRSQIVIRSGETELELLEFDRWAEPLQRNLTRVLVDNLSLILGSRGATVLRWDEGPPMDYRIRIEFTQFDFAKTGEVSLVARWIISKKDERDTIAIRTSRFSGEGVPGDNASLISSMNRHIESLSRDIADTLASLL